MLILNIICRIQLRYYSIPQNIGLLKVWYESYDMRHKALNMGRKVSFMMKTSGQIYGQKIGHVINHTRLYQNLIFYFTISGVSTYFWFEWFQIEWRDTAPCITETYVGNIVVWKHQLRFETPIGYWKHKSDIENIKSVWKRKFLYWKHCTWKHIEIENNFDIRIPYWNDSRQHVMTHIDKMTSSLRQESCYVMKTLWIKYNLEIT